MNHKGKDRPADAPSENEGALEITPEMVEAGLAVLEASGRLHNDRVSLGDRILVRQIYREMESRRPFVPTPPDSQNP